MPVMITSRPPVPRAVRLPLNRPVRYRVVGDEGWSHGTTLNISSTGLLFRSCRVIDANAPMDIQVVLHGDAYGSASVISRASVTRVSKSGDDFDHVIAATLHGSELVRTPRKFN